MCVCVGVCACLVLFVDSGKCGKQIDSCCSVAYGHLLLLMFLLFTAVPLRLRCNH